MQIKGGYLLYRHEHGHGGLEDREMDSLMCVNEGRTIFPVSIRRPTLMNDWEYLEGNRTHLQDILIVQIR